MYKYIQFFVHHSCNIFCKLLKRVLTIFGVNMVVLWLNYCVKPEWAMLLLPWKVLGYWILWHFDIWHFIRRLTNNFPYPLSDKYRLVINEFCHSWNSSYCFNHLRLRVKMKPLTLFIYFLVPYSTYDSIYVYLAPYGSWVS